MKKILFATTALVATAGVAQADVAVTGFAEIGILGGDVYDTTDANGDAESQTQFHTDIDVTFSMTGEADNGLTFGASIDLDETDGNPSGAFENDTQGGETYFVAFGGARLSMGDVDGAFDAALTEVDIGGSIADDHTVHAGFNGNAGMDGTYDGQIATFSYAFEGFTGYLSAEIDDGANGRDKYDPVWGLGASYTVDLATMNLGFGVGYQTGDGDNADATIAAVNGSVGAVPASLTDGQLAGALAAVAAVGAHEREDVFGVSVDLTMDNGLQGIINYSEASYGDANSVFGDLETETHFAIGLGYAMNALTVSVNYGEYNNRFGVDGLEATGYGLAANYDLGGGLKAQFGYGDSEFKLNGASTDMNQYSLGLAMSF
jgi:outer membrane protein OmpU